MKIIKYIKKTIEINIESDRYHENKLRKLLDLEKRIKKHKDINDINIEIINRDIPFSSECDREWLNQVNNSVTFSGKPIRSEEFFNQIVEVLGITIDRRPKERLRKREN